MSDSKKPVSKVSLYPVKAAIWRNDANGQPYYSATFERSYKDEAGNWKSSSSFSGNDLLLLAKAADLAHTEIEKLRAVERQTETEE